MWKSGIILLAVCTSVSALSCMHCSSREETDCHDPTNATSLARFAVECPRRHICRKITFTEGGKPHVIRECAEMAKGDGLGCGWEIRVYSQIGSGYDCFCEEHNCNGASVSALSLLLLAAAAVVCAVTSSG
ncbi:uncharacterized protein LOC119092723 [Pollicipes pollicipes]|uniref:uncharacterized protein LOC119092678 n=1 Tax=Pollicipes pollicipes TaxID=41117 RepID=UPI001884AD72|nr:uncharacterized protein LOC119092678 [Pollicipes pollicipes]XP_037071595.1 uncharacterized protein LOC119092723 [Pollicipes pollicipes]